jgi:hypothetical protein
MSRPYALVDGVAFHIAVRSPKNLKHHRSYPPDRAFAPRQICEDHNDLGQKTCRLL